MVNLPADSKAVARQKADQADRGVVGPGSTIGIVGGGQLGRMMSMAAARLGYHVHIFTPEPNAPASEVSRRTTRSEYTVKQELEAFASSVHVITFEFENIPHESLRLLESITPVHPSPELLMISQNRLREKAFVREHNIGTAPYKRVTSLEELRRAVGDIGFPCIVKTAEMGYDGKGQATLKDDSRLEEVWEQLNTSEAIVEGFVDFTMEISVIAARNRQGVIKLYPPVQNVHKNHILHETIVPAPLRPSVKEKALAIAHVLAEKSGLVGLLAVEMFVTRDGDVLVNEIAPRPHNSGHWSMDGAPCSQFEQAIRAVCGLPLGDSAPYGGARMLNLIGDDIHHWPQYLKDPKARLHLYGKADARPGRKMGHVNWLLED